MNSKKLIITEDEKKYILSMYGIIKETQNTEPKLEIKSSDFFDSGKFSKLSDVGTKNLTIELGKALEFIRANEGSITSIKIFASEDNNPNYNHEVNPPVKLGDLELANRRAKTIKIFLTNFFNEALENGNIKTMPIFEEPETVIGTGQTAAEKKYDRRVEITFSIVSKEKPTTTPPPNNPCAKNMKIRVYYDEGVHGGHNCNSAVFVVTINGKPLTRVDGASYASLNNSGVMDNEGYYIQDKQIQERNEKGKPIWVTKKFPLSNNRGGPRENNFIVDDELMKSIQDANNKISFGLTCKNLVSYYKDPNSLVKAYPEIKDVSEWFRAEVKNPDGKPGTLFHGTQLTYVPNSELKWDHTTSSGTEKLPWRYACHAGVGGIEFINEKGETNSFNVATPQKVNEEKIVLTIDACSLSQI
jgi:hypothetical protein